MHVIKRLIYQDPGDARGRDKILNLEALQDPRLDGPLNILQYETQQEAFSL